MRLLLKLAVVVLITVFAHVMIEISDTVAGSFRMEACDYFGDEEACDVARAEQELAGRSVVTRWVVTHVLDVPVTASRRNAT